MLARAINIHHSFLPSFKGAGRVDHALTPEDLTAIGRDTEASVLARAVRWHAEHRVLLNGLRAVVFR